MPQSVYVGIDLGTTFTGIGYFNPNNRQVKICGPNQAKFPSVVALHNNQILIGQDAENALSNRMIDAQNFFSEFKRLMNEPEANQPFNGSQFTPVELQAELLKHARNIYEKHTDPLNYRVERVVITFPASYDQYGKENVLKAAKLAGITEKLYLLPEPTAGALSFERQVADLREAGSNIVVFDFGGGTLDFSMLQIEQRNGEAVFKPMHPGGDMRLGGKDFDRELLRYAAKLAQNETPSIEHPVLRLPRAQQIKYNSNLPWIEDLLNASEGKAKLNDGRAQAVSQILTSRTTYHAKERILSENQPDIYKNTLSHLNKAVDEYLELLKDNGFELDDISHVVMVGGSSNLKVVQQILFKKFGKKDDGVTEKCILPQGDIQLAILEGACLYSFDPEKVSGNVSAVSYGVRLNTPRKSGDDPNFHYINEEGEKFTIKVVKSITKGQHINKPIQKSLVTASSSQDRITVEVYVGEGTYPGIGTEQIGTATFYFGRRVPKGTPVQYEWFLDKQTYQLTLTLWEKSNPKRKISTKVEWKPQS